jgi:type IV secretory pathway VirB2 component (pilin)
VTTANLRITRRGIQIALGLIWLLDGILQFQSYMYSREFIPETIEPMLSMQPAWVAHSIHWAGHLAGSNLTVWNTLFALVQCAIGLGLLYRPTVRPALALSFGWSLVVWWFGEGFGMLLMNMGSPFSGAPGAVLLYAVIGLLVWPTRSRDTRSAAASGPLGERGGLAVWSAVWGCSALLWLEVLTRSVYSISGSLIEASGDSMPWLSSLQRSLSTIFQGDGKSIAAIALVVSLAVAAGVWTRWRREALILGILISLLYWTLGQSLGGLTSGDATDPNIGPLFVLLAFAVWPTAPASEVAPSPPDAQAVAGARSPGSHPRSAAGPASPPSTITRQGRLASR